MLDEPLVVEVAGHRVIDSVRLQIRKRSRDVRLPSALLLRGRHVSGVFERHGGE